MPKIYWLAFFLAVMPAPLAIASDNPAPGEADAPTFTLDIAAQPAAEVKLAVSAPTTVHFNILRGGGGVSSANLDLSPFTNEQGVTLPVQFLVPGALAAGVTHFDKIPLNQQVIPVDLVVPSFPAGGSFSGRLILSGVGAAPGAKPFIPTVWRFTLSANDLRPATLVVDQNAVSLAGVRAWCLLWTNYCFWEDAPTVTVHVRDKTGAWPLSGVTARLEPGLTAPGAGLDPNKHIMAEFDDRPVSDIFASPGPGARDVPAHHQATVRLDFKMLPAGEYTFPLRFTAMNSAEDDAQRFTATVKMRGNLLTAAIWLVLGAGASWFATRFVDELSLRAAFLERLRALSPVWLKTQPRTLPVVALLAARSQCARLSSRVWLSGQDEVEARFDEAENLLSVLDRTQQVQQDVQEKIRNPTVRRRANWRLDGFIRDIGAGPLGKADVERLKKSLDELENWCGDPAQEEACYWADLKEAIRSLCDEVGADTDNEFARTPGAAQDAKNLLVKLTTALTNEPSNMQRKKEVEIDYDRLSILWELRSTNLATTLVQGGGIGKIPINDIYNLVDDHWWQCLKSKASSCKLVQSGSSAARDTYEIFTLALQIPDDQGLSSSYLVHQKLKWDWTINNSVSNNNTNNWLWRGEYVPRQVSTTQPGVAYYAARTGSIKAEVRVSYRGDFLPSPINLAEPITVYPSDEFKVLRLFEARSIISTLLALVFALVSGLMVYALAPSFGAVKEYLTLFIWAAGVDQSKNFLQSLATYAPAKQTQASVMTPATGGK